MSRLSPEELQKWKAENESLSVALNASAAGNYRLLKEWLEDRHIEAAEEDFKRLAAGEEDV